MAKNLVIVESPAKAKTIEKYLGGDFTVLSSVGHIRSIPKKSKDGTPVVDIKNGFKTQYEVDPEKKKILAELKKAVKSAETVWLATDEDREGEAIAWHLCEVLGLDPAKTNRDVFADKGYPSAEREAKLKTAGYRNYIQRKGHRNQPLSECQERRNRRIVKTRARVEHMFGAIEQMGGKLIRPIG